MDKLIWTNNDEKRFEDLLKEYGEKADRIFIASAFFTETKLITEWTKSGKNVEILVRLMPPTNYDSLNEIYLNKISIWFLGKSFHSKFYVFFNNGNPYAIIIGSSNFTGGGLRNNIETNAILEDPIYLNEIEKEITELKKHAQFLEDKHLEEYKHIYNESKPIQKEYAKIRDLYSEIKQFKSNNSLLANKDRNKIVPKESIKDMAFNLIQFEFWKMFINESNKRNELFKKISPLKANWITISLGMDGVGISLYITKKYCCIRLFINGNKELFDFLEKRKEDIETKFGSKLGWNRMDKNKSSRIRYTLENVNVMHKEDWSKMIKFLIDSSEKMVNVFKEPINNFYSKNQ